MITYAGRTEERVNLLLVSILLNALLGIVHDSYDILHLLVGTSKDIGLIVYLKDVTTQGSVYIKISKLIVIECQQFGIQCAVIKFHILQLSCLLTRCGAADEILERHEVHIGTDSTLQLQMLSDIPDGLTSKTEHILTSGVLVLVQIPIRVLVILVVTIPVGIVTILGLVVLQPSLIVSTSQCHEVLTDIALRVAQCRTVLNILASIVGCEVEINRTCRCVYTQVEVITTHVCIRQNVLVTHIGNAETNTCLTRVN